MVGSGGRIGWRGVVVEGLTYLLTKGLTGVNMGLTKGGVMPYKDKEKRKIAAKKAMRRSRGLTEGLTFVNPDENVNPCVDSDVNPLLTPVNPEDVALIVDTILSNRPAVVPDAIYKILGNMEKEMGKLNARITELEKKLMDLGDNRVDFSKIKKTDKSDSIATDTGLCPKHQRIRIPGKPSCC